MTHKPYLDDEEFFEIAKSLEVHHGIFSQLWRMGTPEFTDKIATAAVFFDKIGNTIAFKINREFWSSLTKTQKEFVICHECLHVILYHGFRINNISPQEAMMANTALDLVVNNLIVKKYGFDRKEIDPNDIYVWKDKVFADDVNVDEDDYFEKFYNLLKQGKGKGDFTIVDDHSLLGSFTQEEFEQFVKDNVSKFDLEDFVPVVEKNTKDIKEQIKQAGCAPGNVFKKVAAYYKPKQKWETVIKRWAIKCLGEMSVDQWLQKNRRFSAIDIKNLFLPTENDVEDYHEKKKIDVWFFQDTSGSCVHFAQRFFAAANTLSRNRFNIRMFCFDTAVYETTLASGKLYGFGGTSFTCIEEYIMKEIRNDLSKYPKAVFVITDGYGDSVNPKLPKNWYWFLSDPYKECIPKECNIAMLKDYE